MRAPPVCRCLGGVRGVRGPFAGDETGVDVEGLAPALIAGFGALFTVCKSKFNTINIK